MADPTSNSTSFRASDKGRHEACIGRRAFSMVELLVVLAVVMALIGILLPGLQSARRTAYGVICGANQRQIGIGLLLWSEDHSGHLPESMLQDNNEFAEMMAVTTGATGEYLSGWGEKRHLRHISVAVFALFFLAKRTAGARRAEKGRAGVLDRRCFAPCAPWAACARA